MDILVVQVLCLIALFGSTLILTVLPLHIIGKQRDTTKVFYGKYELLISYANCLSGGVFLATFFVALMPEVREETKQMMTKAQLATSVPLTEVIILIGFFLAMFIEQLAVNAKDLHKNKNNKRNSAKVEEGNEPQISDDNIETEHSPLEVNDVRANVGGTASTSLVGEIDDAEVDHVIPDSINQHDNSNQLVMIIKTPAGEETVKHANNHAHNNVHGHGHSHNVEALVLESTAGVRLGILLLSLGVHCLFEGMALGLQSEIHTFVNLFVGIWIHECLIALALGFSIVQAGPKTCRMWQMALFFSCLIPIGQIIGIVIGTSQSWTSQVISVILQGIAAGTFVQVTFLDIIPEGLGPVGSPKRLSKVGLLFLGFVIITVISLLVELFGSHQH